MYKMCMYNDVWRCVAAYNAKEAATLSSCCLFLRMLSQADSNHHKQNQNLLCYHYTIGQTYRCVRYEPLFSDPPSHNSTAKVMLFLGLPKFFAVFSCLWGVWGYRSYRSYGTYGSYRSYRGLMGFIGHIGLIGLMGPISFAGLAGLIVPLFLSHSPLPSITPLAFWFPFLPPPRSPRSRPVFRTR